MADNPWGDIPLAEQNQLEDFAVQVTKDTGGQIVPTEDQLVSMAKQGIGDYKHFAMDLWDTTALTDAQRQSMPWIGVGMTEQEYGVTVRALADEYQRLTGKAISPWGSFTIKNGYITDPAFQQIWDAMRQGMTPSDFGNSLVNDKNAIAMNPGLPQGLDFFQTQQKEANLSGIYKELTGVAAPQDLLAKSVTLDPTAFRANLVTDPNILNTYGWLKYGKNYEQFQQYKAEQRQMVGHDLTDQQGVTQLQYTHETTHILGAYQTAQLKPEQQSQQAVQAGAPGTGQSETR